MLNKNFLVSVQNRHSFLILRNWKAILSQSEWIAFIYIYPPVWTERFDILFEWHQKTRKTLSHDFSLEILNTSRFLVCKSQLIHAGNTSIKISIVMTFLCVSYVENWSLDWPQSFLSICQVCIIWNLRKIWSTVLLHSCVF